MSAWWITFANRGAACLFAPGETDEQAARDAAAAHGVVEAIAVLPYPARPRLDTLDGWNRGECPSFCYTPAKCAGRTSCKAKPSCVD